MINSKPIRATLARPCPMCPFSKVVDLRLRPMRRKEIAESLLTGAPFPCHKTTVDRYGFDGEESDEDTARFCAGALVWLNKIGQLEASLYVHLLRLSQLQEDDAVAIGKKTEEEAVVFFNEALLLGAWPNIFDTVEAFVGAPSTADRPAKC